jgi:high affinity Mn2+ porin
MWTKNKRKDGFVSAAPTGWTKGATDDAPFNPLGAGRNGGANLPGGCSARYLGRPWTWQVGRLDTPRRRSRISHFVPSWPNVDAILAQGENPAKERANGTASNTGVDTTWGGSAATLINARSALVAVLFGIAPCLPYAAIAAATDGTDASTPDTSAPENIEPEAWSLHGQFTNVTQYHPPFTSPVRGANSLDPGHRGDETVDATLFAGIRVWDGLEFYANPEIDQGFGLSDTLGAAGFPSGEAYKVGAASPYVRLHRAFFRYSFGTGGEDKPIQPAANQLAGMRQSDNVILTAGKFSVTDIFDTNTYAHDPKADFLNWSVIDAGAFDYAADSWGYSYGAAAEWTRSWWTLRGGLFDLSKVPNDKQLTMGFNQYEAVLEGEERHEIVEQPGKVKVLFFANHGRMANYTDAIRAATGTGAAPDVSVVRRSSTRPGVTLNVEQQITEGLGAFARASLNDGHKEAYEFTEINRSISTGLALTGARWHRPDDTVGLAGVLNDISKDARNYLAAGGLGILIGDGALPKTGFEKIVEVYYKASIVEGVQVSLDFQRIENPGYDASRGPVNVVSFRLHAEF